MIAIDAQPAVGGVRPSRLVLLLRACRRRKVLLLAPAVGLGVGAYLLMTVPAPVYVADALVALESRKIQVVAIDSVVSRLSQENAVIRTELDIVGSYGTAGLVVDRLFAESPQSAWAAVGYGKPGVVQRVGQSLAAVCRDIAERVRASCPAADWLGPEAQRGPPTREDIIEGLLSRLRASNDGRSLTIMISFRSDDPELAARVANLFAEEYIGQQVLAKRNATREAADWLAGRLTEMRGNLEASEQALFGYRMEAGLVETRGLPLREQQLNELNTQLVLSRAGRLRAESRLRTARLIRQRGGEFESFAEVLQSPTIQKLRSDESALRQQIGELRGTGGQNDPRIPRLEAGAESLRRQMAGEMDRILTSLAAEVTVASQWEQDLEAVVREMETRHGAASQGLVRLNELQREAEANRSIYESFLTRYKQTVEQLDLAQPDARVVSAAIPPRTRSGPPVAPVIGLAALAGLGLGVGAVSLAERLSKVPRSLGDLEAMTGIPVLGLIPAAARRRRRALLAGAPATADEALERAFSMLVLRRGERPTRSVLVTSAMPREGRTAFCIALARSLARSGLKVLVVDADLRSPRVAAAFGAPAGAPLQDVVSGAVLPEEALRMDPDSSACFIGAARRTTERRTLLSSPGFTGLIGAMTGLFDVVLIDTPPVLAATDAAAVAGIADARLLYVRWTRTPTAMIGNALQTLRLCGVTVDGIVAGGVDAEEEQEAAEDWRGGMVPVGATLPSRA